MNKLELQLFYSKLDNHRQRWGLSWHKLAAQAKVSSTVRIRMAQGREPNAEDLVKLRAWLDAWGDRWS